MSAPAIVVRLEIETAPQVYVEAPNRGARYRLYDWIHSQPELAALVHTAEQLRVVDDLLVPEFNEIIDLRLRGGKYQNMTLDQVAASGREGERWFAGMLARLHPEDRMRRPIEEFVQERLPHLWERYSAWQSTQVAA